MTNPAYEATNSDVEKLMSDMKVKPVGNFVFEPSGKRWHHIKNGEYRHAEPKLPKVKLYSGLDIAGLQFELRKANQRIAELESAPNGMMQLSNELAEMKRKFAELETAGFKPVKLPELVVGDYGHKYLLNAREVVEAIQAAGGTVEGGE